MHLKVVGADLWLSSALADIQDGFLSVVRLHDKEYVAYGALQEPKVMEEAPLSHVFKRKSTVIKTFRSVKVKLNQKEPTTIELCHTKCNNLNVEISIFMMIQQDPKANKQMERSIHFLSNGVFRMAEKDLEIITSTTASTEVNATAPLEENAGDIHVLFSLCVAQEDTQKSTQKEGFSIHFTSTEALEKDLQLKARQNAEEEVKLLARLKRIEALAVKLRDQRRLEIQRFRLFRAARCIQKGFRLHLERRKKEREQRETEEKERLKARKAQVKQKVKERSQKRTRAMVNQIKAAISLPLSSPLKALTEQQQHQEESSKQEHVPFSMGSFIKQREQEELQKLQSKLSHLKHQKDQLLNQIQQQQKKEEQKDLQNINLNTKVQKKNEKTNDTTKPIDQDLIQAIQQVYFRK